MKLLAKDLTDGRSKAISNIDVTTAGLLTTANVFSSIGLDIATQGSRPANVAKGVWLNNSNELRFYDGSSDYEVAHSGTALGGDLSGTLGSAVVGNDSHTHGNGTLTGVPGSAIDTTALHSGDSAGGDLSGTYPTNLVVQKIQGDQIYASIAPSDGQVLTWDNANSRWNAVTPVSGVTTLAALTDTDVSSPSSGQLLLWDGSNSWDNKSMSGDVTIASTGATVVDKIQGDDVYASIAPTDGQVLTWDNSNSRWDAASPGAPSTSKVRAYNNSSQSISTATLTTLQFSSESYDTLGDFNTGTYRFVAPVDGYYLVQATILVPGTATNWFAYINHNGTGVVEVSHHGTGSGSSTLNIHDVVSMTNGQYIEIQVFHFQGGSLILGSGSNHTYFTVTRLP